MARACRALGIAVDLSALRAAAGTNTLGTTLTGLSKAAASVGLTAQGVQVDRDALQNLSPPAIAWVDGNHYVTVLAIHGDTVVIDDPNKSHEEDIPASELLTRSGGVLLTLTKKTDP